MRVGGIQWMTLLDYPDHVAATVFTAGCNLRCPFCHNAELVLPELIEGSSQELGDVFFDALSERAGFLDAIVLSGGEPTLQPDLPSVLRSIPTEPTPISLKRFSTRGSSISWRWTSRDLGRPMLTWWVSPSILPRLADRSSFFVPAAFPTSFEQPAPPESMGTTSSKSSIGSMAATPIGCSVSRPRRENGWSMMRCA